MRSIRKQRRFGCWSSPFSPTWYRNRNKRWISIRTCDRHCRLSRVCIPVFPILYLPRLLSPVYIITSPLALILKPRRQMSHFTLIAAIRTLALATAHMQNLPQ